MTAADFTLTEYAIRALTLRLASDLPGELAATAAASDDLGVDTGRLLVPPVPEQLLDFAPGTGHLVEYPTVAVTEATDSDLEDDIGSSATGVHRIAILVFLQDVDQRTLAWGLRRYMQATTRTALAGRRLPLLNGADTAWGMTARGIHWGPTLEAIESPKEWMSFAGLQLELRRDEV